jgi:hypothetical protein
MAKQTTSSNPLLSKNILPPPMPRVERQNGITVERQNGIPAEIQIENMPVPVAPSLPVNENEENATIELSLYLRPSQDDKLEDLRRAYKKRKGKKISANEVIRRLIDQATLDSIL